MNLLSTTPVFDWTPVINISSWRSQITHFVLPKCTTSASKGTEPGTKATCLETSPPKGKIPELELWSALAPHGRRLFANLKGHS